MARRKKFIIEDNESPALDISSLIDVCFLLLIYFLVTSVITRRETDLGLALPGASISEGKPPPIEPMLISIGANGAISVGNPQTQMDADMALRETPLLSQELKSYADAARSSRSVPLVQMYVESDAPYQRVIDVMNALSAPEVDIKSVTFTDLVE